MMMMIQAAKTEAVFLLLSIIAFPVVATVESSSTTSCQSSQASALAFVASITTTQQRRAPLDLATITTRTTAKWSSPSPAYQIVSSSSSSSTRLYNILDDIGDMLGGPFSSTQQLVAQTGAPLPHDAPFCKEKSCSDSVRTFAVQERLFTFTGEDFDVYEACSFTGNKPFLKVRGAMLHLPGKDKMRIQDAGNGRDLLELDRKLVAATPTYDIYRGRGEQKIGWIEKKLISMTDSFDVYMEGKGGFGITGLFKPPPAYRITGDFMDRNFVMRNEQGQAVARVSEDWVVEFDQFNHYQVQVAPGMDAVLVMACLCAIDEEFDEEHKQKKANNSKKQQ